MTEITPWTVGDGFDAEIIGHIQNKGWDKLPAAQAAAQAVRQAREAEKLIGVPANQIIRLPADPNDAAGMKAVWNRLGVPADPKEYDFSTVKRANGEAPDAKFLDHVRAQAAALNIPKAAATQLAAAFVKLEEDNATAAKAEYTVKIAAEKQELAKNWGANVEANTFVAKKAAAALGVTAEDVAVLEGQIGFKRVMDMFLSIGQKIGEDKFVSNGAPGGNGVMSREQAVARRADLMKDTAWGQRYLQGGVTEVAEMTALNTLIVGDDTHRSAQSRSGA